MAKISAFAKPFAGRWRIVEMDVWDNDDLNEGGEAHITFRPGSDGEIAFVALSGNLDVRYSVRDGRPAQSSPGRAPMMVRTPVAAAGS
jgi:hypothetical protein